MRLNRIAGSEPGARMMKRMVACPSNRTKPQSASRRVSVGDQDRNLHGGSGATGAAKGHGRGAGTGADRARAPWRPMANVPHHPSLAAVRSTDRHPHCRIRRCAARAPPASTAAGIRRSNVPHLLARRVFADHSARPAAGRAARTRTVDRCVAERRAEYARMFKRAPVHAAQGALRRMLPQYQQPLVPT